MKTPENTAREPCPYRIINDTGKAFTLGALGSSIFNFTKGFFNFPSGTRLTGAVHAVRLNAVRTGGSLAVWGAVFSTLDSAMIYARRRDDPWNSIISGAATGGVLRWRCGIRAASRAALAGGVLLGVVQCAGIWMNRILSPAPGMVVDDPLLTSMVGGGIPPGSIKFPDLEDDSKNGGSSSTKDQESFNSPATI